MTRTISSLLDGVSVPGAPGGTYVSKNPARLAETVAEVSLGDAATFVEAARLAAAAQPSWAATPAPVRGRVIAQVGRLVEGQQRSVGGPGHR